MIDSMDYKANELCLICGSKGQKVLGLRGNQEYLNAPKSQVHYVTNVVQCKECSFIYCNPTIIQAEELEKTHYNNSAIYKDSDNKVPGKPYLHGLNAILKFNRKGNLLDVGAGKGEFLDLAKSNGFTVRGIEPSPQFCKYALEILGISIFCGTVPEYRKASSSAEKQDFITLFHVLEHVKDPKEILLELRPLFSSSGICYIEVPNADATLLRFVDFIYKLVGKNWSSRLSPTHPPFHSIGYTKNSLKRLIEDSEYEIIEFWTFTGKDRGHQIRHRFGVMKRIIRSVLVRVIGIFPNKELIGALVRPNGAADLESACVGNSTRDKPVIGE
jgi:2-polyprenyl-3-methyl-5-hydroxy-6-metoxy-1,4-benzoquinol methylase